MFEEEEEDPLQIDSDAGLGRRINLNSKNMSGFVLGRRQDQSLIANFTVWDFHRFQSLINDNFWSNQPIHMQFFYFLKTWFFS